jgi:hypothetical protein
MESEQPVEKTAGPAEEKPLSPAGRDNNRRERDVRRPRFRRDDRGRGADRVDRGDRTRTHEEGGNKASGTGSVREAIRHVEHIRGDLRRVLDEINEVIRVLEQAEREKTASEGEIEQLRESLRHLQHDRGHGRYPRAGEPRQAPVREVASAEEEEPEREEE